MKTLHISATVQVIATTIGTVMHTAASQPYYR